MSDVAVHVEGISKRYRIGGPKEAYGTLRDSLASAASAPWRTLRGRADSQANEFWALRDVSFDVKHGEVLGIIGRNGAGKSTLLKILSRITEPTNGRATINGRVGSLLEVGTGFHPELTGRENVYLNGAILGISKRDIDARFDEIVEFAEVEQFLDTPVKRYSSGMYTRLAFSVAAHLEPEILIVDEVLSVGDAEFQRKSIGKMGDVASQGRTVLFVSHNMSAVLNLCNRGILLQRGSVVAAGSARAIMETYTETATKTATDRLSSSTDRVGAGRLRFERVWFEDVRGNPTEQPVSGETLVIALEYRSDRSEIARAYRMSVGIESSMGERLFDCSTEIAQQKTAPLTPSGVVRCTVPKLPLREGRYYLTLFAEVNGDVEDWLQSAVPLDVVEGDFFGTGQQYTLKGQGRGLLVQHTWDVAPCS